MNLIFNLFDNCNLRCSYCYKNNIAGLNKKRLNPIPNDLIFEIIEESFNYFKDIKIQITGGEPFIDPKKVLNILSFLANHTDRLRNITITTNGTLITKQIAKEIMRILPQTEIDITIDGPSELHNYTRTSKGKLNSYIQTQNALKILKSVGIKLTINSVITKKHLELNPEDYYTFMQNMNVPWIFGKVVTNNNRDKISEKDFNSFAMKVLYCWSMDHSSTSNTFVDSMLLHAMKIVPISNFEQCSLASISFAGAEGYAWPCVKLIPYEKFCLGAYVKDGFETIINHPLRQEIFDFFSKKETCIHESLIENGIVEELPVIAEERKKFLEFIKRAI